MGVDSYVLLRVRDEEALRGALATLTPQTRARRLADGSVSIFTGHRYDDDDADFTIRCWLEAQFGAALSRIHDDPRGVLVAPDFTDTRALTYDKAIAIATLAGVGHFIDPAPPTEEERARREKAISDLIEGVRQQTVPPPSGAASELAPLEGFSSILSKLARRDMTGDLATVSRGRLSTSPPPMEPDE